MGVRGKQSQVSGMVVVPFSGKRLSAPENLTAEQAQEWRNIVDSLPADYFRPGDIPLLSAFCVASAFYKAATAQMQAEGIVLDGPDKFSKEGICIGQERRYPHPAASILQSQASAMAQMAIKLRLCPSARYTEQKAATKAGVRAKDKRPWDEAAS